MNPFHVMFLVLDFYDLADRDWHNLPTEMAKVVICSNFHATNKNWKASNDSIQILEEILEGFINATNQFSKHYLKSRTDFVKKKDSNLGSS